MAYHQLPIPRHFDPKRVGEVWKVPYQARAGEAEQWARQHHLSPAVQDRFKVCLMMVDVQNSFCTPGFELFVGGRSGTGAVDDNRRLCQFIYRNLHAITQIVPTMDTHQAMQIFHALFWVNARGEHPAPYTLISEDDVTSGQWQFNPALGSGLGLDEAYVQRHLLSYTRALNARSKYDLTIWPYHVLLGSIGHALVSAVEEAVFFHSVARYSQPRMQVKGDHPLTEHYSVLGPEVLDGPDGDPIAHKNTFLIEQLLQFDAVIIAGQAKSHCVAWTVDDLLADILARDRRWAEKVYLLEDCTSPVVVLGAMDYTDAADAAFQRFADAGMHLVASTDPMDHWPGLRL
jgi:nicotinamidase-related amidase